jgi:hypothetical protein
MALTVEGGAGGRSSGSWSVGHSVISGSRAIVDVEYLDASIPGCPAHTACLNNTDPNAGLPHAGLSFAAAYELALDKPGYAVDCVRVGGRWYVWTVEGESQQSEVYPSS